MKYKHPIKKIQIFIFILIHLQEFCNGYLVTGNVSKTLSNQLEIYFRKIQRNSTHLNLCFPLPQLLNCYQNETVQHLSLNII